MSNPTSSAPNLLDLLTRPREFFAALKNLRPSHSRYLWVVLLSGLISGLYAMLSQRAVQEAMSAIPGLPGGNLGMVFGVITGLLTSVIVWLILWGLGSLGAGKEGRASEVYGATFLTSLLVCLILLPLTALFPLQVNVPPPSFSGLEGPELMQAVQQYTRALQAEVSRQPMSILGNVLTYGAMAWQFWLAYVGLGVLTGDRRKALRGVLIPLILMLLLGGAGLLLGRVAGSLA